MFTVARITQACALGAAALLLAGCPSGALRAPPPPSVERAETLEHQGDPAAAAKVYEALGEENAGADRADFQLRAARAWLAANRPEEAERVLASLEANLAAPQAFERGLVAIEISLARGHGPQAWSALQGLKEPAVAPAAEYYFALKQRAALAVGRPADAVRAAIARERFLSSQQALADSRAALLRQLRDASERGVHMDAQNAKEPLVQGWLELAGIAAAMARSPAASAPQFEAWRARFPNHPGAEVVRAQAATAPAVSATPVVEAGAHVALLLPVSGHQAAAGASVRDGFMAAFYRLPEASRPEIRVYDTGAISVASAVAQASSEGAQFIVGPLTREEAIAASELATRHPPILALNFLPIERPAASGFYQFALSPEDEARQVARRIVAQGLHRGVAFAIEGDWGTRVVTAFNEELRAGGGELIAQASLPAGRADFSPSITQVLHISDSHARHKRLESLLGTQLQFEPRRRGDVEFIFLASQAPLARLLCPQLRFHYAGDIPTFATSDAFDPSATANDDMEGLVFNDMPWMLGDGALTHEVSDAARDAWPTGGPRRGRLFAFGFDAFNLIGALRGAGPLRLEGLTGTLTLDAERRVRRDLEWAQMHAGQPQVLERAQN
ncbi:MAG TPA: penicillin-binding protein activator [Steroidobacteraceae bacterium]